MVRQAHHDSCPELVEGSPFRTGEPPVLPALGISKSVFGFSVSIDIRR